MREMRTVIIGVGLLAVCFMVADFAMAGTVYIDGGKTREGRVIVRENVVTINTQDNKLFQFYTSRVEKIITNEEGKFLLGKDVFLKQEPKDDAASVVELTKGMEVEEVEQGEGWTKVKGIKDGELGWVKSDLLVNEVDLAQEEQATEAAAPEAATEEVSATTGEMEQVSEEPEAATSE